MKPRERFLRGCREGEPDELSVAPFLKATACEVAGVSIKSYCETGESMARAQMESAKLFGVDSVNAASDVLIEAETMGSRSNRPENEFPRLEVPALDIMAVDELPMPDVRNDGRFPVKIEAVRAMSQGDYAVIAWVMSAFQLAAQLRGFKGMIVDLMRGDRDVRPLLDRCLKVSSDFARVLVEEGADVIAIGNASSSMDVLSPGTYIGKLAAYDRKLAESIRKTGALVQMHICGNITPILGELDRLVDVVDVDHKVGIFDAISGLKKAVLKGNLDPSVLRFCTAEDVRLRTKVVVDAVRSSERKGLFIFSTGCEVPPKTPHAAIKAMVAAAREAWGGAR